ncbi:MAG: hypothetical protein P8X90_14275 [Desulfobacterales bacterium]
MHKTKLSGIHQALNIYKEFQKAKKASKKISPISLISFPEPQKNDFLTAFFALKFKGRKIMFRKLFVVAFIIILSAQAKLSWGENYDFRFTRWGMTPEEVIASESKLDPIEKGENLIKYKTQLLGKNVELVYHFAQNKLVGSSYKLEDNYLNSQHFITTYQKLKAALAQKYGPAIKDEIIWTNDAYRNVSNKRGLALSLGHVKYLAIWETPDTTIACSLKEENFYVNCSVEYSSKQLSALQQAIKKEDKMDPL